MNSNGNAEVELAWNDMGAWSDELLQEVLTALVETNYEKLSGREYGLGLAVTMAIRTVGLKFEAVGISPVDQLPRMHELMYRGITFAALDGATSAVRVVEA